MRAVKVKPKDAEQIRRKLTELDVFNSNYHVKKSKEYIYFPVVDLFHSKEFEIVEIEMDERNNRKKLRDYLNLENLRSFDVIGYCNS